MKKYAAMSLLSELPVFIPACVVSASRTVSGHSVHLRPWERFLLRCSCLLSSAGGGARAGLGREQLGICWGKEQLPQLLSHLRLTGCRREFELSSRAGRCSSLDTSRGAAHLAAPYRCSRQPAAACVLQRCCPLFHPTAALLGCFLSKYVSSLCQDAKLVKAFIWSGGCAKLSV